MSGISIIKGWCDTKYVEGSTEIPPVGHTLGTPDITLEGPFNPSKDKEFSEIRLEIPFSEAMNLSYLEIHYDFNNGDDQVFYAWVDDVRLMSDSADAPMVSISYHIDPWRTFNSKLHYGSGFVIRRPSTASDYYQSYPYRYMKFKSEQTLVAPNIQNLWWVLISINEKKSDNVSRNTIAFFPTWAKTDALGAWTDDEHQHSTMTVEDMIECRFDEKMGIDPKTIMGVWVCPYCPFTPQSGYDSPFGFVNSTVKMHITQLCKEYDHAWEITEGGLTTRGHSGWFQLESAGSLGSGPYAAPFKEYPISIQPVTSTEKNPVFITGFNGETLGAIPFGMTVTSGNYRVVYGVTSAYLEFRFNDGIHANSEGLTIATTLPEINANDNSWSSYVYSGQRDYDIQQRNLGSISGTIESSASQGGMGALLGAMGNYDTMGQSAIVKNLMKSGLSGAAAGGIAGALVGAGASLIGGGIAMVFNDQFQQAEDRLHARQPDGMLFVGTGIDYMYHGQGVMLCVMEFDEASSKAIEDLEKVQGVRYSMPMSDCTDLINKGGPMQINNLIVTGSVPVNVKNWVRQRFASGVRIIAR